eukprot:scaffold393668_cov23-Prasinocladus_malaysianus.AAC.1
MVHAAGRHNVSNASQRSLRIATATAVGRQRAAPIVSTHAAAPAGPAVAIEPVAGAHASVIDRFPDIKLISREELQLF